MATNVLQEKITKSGKSFQSFKDVLNNRRVKDIGAAYEFSETLPDIREYLNTAKVSFEFECYLNIGKEYVPTKTAIVSRNKIIYPDVITDPYEMMETLYEYFNHNSNFAAYERLNLAYIDYCKEILKRKGLPDEDFDDVYNESEPEWVDSTFSSLRDIIIKFAFHHVDTRWEDYDYENLSFLSKEKEKAKEETDVDFNDFLDEAYEVVANRIGRIFGDTVFVDAEGFNSQFKKKTTDSWFLENDTSLYYEPDDSMMIPIEIITPHWPASVALANMDKFKRTVFDYFKGSTQSSESSIGCHTNITFPEGSHIDLVKLIILSNSQHWAGMMGRANNGYAEPQMNTFLEKIKITNTNGMSLSEFRSFLSRSIKMDKFTDINFLKSNMIEFRFPGNDYFGKLYEQMINTVKWLLYSMTVATTPELFRAEYINRLARLKNTPKYEDTGFDELHAITNTIFYTISDKTITMPKRFKKLIERMANNSLEISREMTVKIKEETDNIRDYYGIEYDYITVGEVIQYINNELPEYNFPRYKSIKQKLAIIISVLGYDIFGENK